MIGRIRGKLLDKQPPELIIEVNGGLGYEVNAPMSTFYKLPEVGAEVSLYTHCIIREDAQILFGFMDAKERSLFKTLIKANGVGPKLSLTILSSFEPSAFVACVQNQDIAALTKVPGIGKRTAEKLLVEMRSRLADWGVEADLNIETLGVTSVITSSTSEAVNALVALGYKQVDAQKAVARVNDDSLSCEELIRQALKGMMTA